jgi:serine/threonine-protein kinase
MIGKTVSHYKILEKLGEGGMGVVYKAQDTKLDRLVALKFLPPHLAADEQDKKRLIHEAKAASALDHQNICTIFEIDETPGSGLFISMALYEGSTIDTRIAQSPLRIEETLNIALQTADGLQAAHQKGIIHRDIKSSNIMVTSSGRVVLMDFGLARSGGMSKLTKTGSTVGTVPYMSPEQARGDKLDHRTDIWSFGMVLYEMITGRLPFKSDYNDAVIYSILNQDPEPVTALRTGVPMELERITKKCLEKDPSDRYQHAEEIIVDLRRVKTEFREEVSPQNFSKRTKLQWQNWHFVGAVAAFIIAVLLALYFIFYSKPDSAGRKSIAVLPFANFSEDKEDYFSDGITEELINALSKLEGLHVAARTSSFAFKGKTEDIRKIGQQLGVATVLEGSVRKVGSTLRITAQLNNVADGYHLWSNTYERELKDVFAVQDDITRNIVSELRIKLHEGERPVLSSRTTNAEAHDLYLRGRFFMNTSSEEGLRKALEYFRLALEKDPGYATPYAGIAFTYVWLADAYLPPTEAYPRAKAAAGRALELDSTNVEAHAALGSVMALYDWDSSLAERESRRAIELSPNSFEAHFWYSQILLVSGRLDEALVENEIGRRLDPLSALSSWQKMWCLYAAHRFDNTIEQQKKMLELDPHFFYLDVFSGAAYRAKRMYTESLEEYHKARTLTGEIPLYGLAITHARMGEVEAARKILGELSKLRAQRYVPADQIAMIYANIDEKDKAFDWLNRAYAERSALLLFCKNWPEYDPIRSDPRFAALMKKMYGEK